MSLDYTQFGTGLSGFSAFENPEVLELVRNTINLRVGKQTPFKGSIDGTKVNAFATLKSAKLSRLTLLRQTRKQPSTNASPDYYIVTGMFSSIDMEISVEDGGKLVPLYSVWRNIANAQAGTKYSDQEFLAHLSRMGMNYTLGGFQLYFQQMGADPDKIEHTFNLFRDLGGYDDVSAMQKATRDASRPQRMERALKTDNPIKVNFFELSSQDRDKIEINKYIKNGPKQGFINLVDAMTNQLNRVSGMRQAAFVLEKEVENNDSLTDKKVKDINAEITKLRNASSQYVQVWSGSQRIARINETTKQPEFTDLYAPTNAPCGRFDLEVDGQTINVDLWRNSVRDGQNADNGTQVPTLKTLSADSDPLG